MTTYQYPILVWQDASGGWTATLIGDIQQDAAAAATKDEALRQLKELLEWRAEHESWNVDPDFEDTALIEVNVDVRPQYRIRGRMVPCPETVRLRVPCVTGRHESGLRLCVIPHLEVEFNFHDPDDLKSLVAHYVKDAMHGCSPPGLAAHMPPNGCSLEQMTVRLETGKARRLPPADRPELKVLFAVADPLLHERGRGRPGSSAYCRETLVEDIATRLASGKGNLLLVGPPGVGKSLVLLDAAKRSIRLASDGNGEGPDDTPIHESKSYRFWRGSGGRMIAGMRYLGEWEERCEEFIARLSSMNGVFCADNLLELCQVGGRGAGDSVAAFLTPYLQRGEIRMAAEATEEEVNACRRLIPGLLDMFETVRVTPFDDLTAAKVLERIASASAATARIEIEPGAPAVTQRLFGRFQPYRAMPGDAADFLRKLCEQRGKLTGGDRIVSRANVIEQFARHTGLPEIFLRDELPLSVTTVREWFDARIIHQPSATNAASKLVATIKAGLTDPERPLGVFLFCGPTGVGKTQLAKSLTEYCFGAAGEKDRLVRLDMSEYSDWRAARRFFYNAQGTPAAWIERVRRQPFCVVLFDEIEKAAPEIFDVLLGLLDEGRLTDPFGRVTWFRSAVVILTSNIGAGGPDAAGFRSNDAPSYESEVAKFFRPEFVNRLDSVITFQPLNRASIELITRKELEDLAAREGLASAGIQLDWAGALVRALALEGYDHRLGARPLQRVIERRVAVPLARWRVANPKFRKGKLAVDLDGNGSVIVRSIGAG